MTDDDFRKLANHFVRSEIQYTKGLDSQGLAEWLYDNCDEYYDLCNLARTDDNDRKLDEMVEAFRTAMCQSIDRALSMIPDDSGQS